MKLYHKKQQFGQEVNIAPLIDVVFLLIIFCLLLSPYSNASPEQITLPGAQSNADARSNAPRELVITMSKEGRIFYEDKQHELEALKLRLRLMAEQYGPEQVQLYLRIDGKTPYPKLQPILSTCAELKIKNIRKGVQSGN